MATMELTDEQMERIRKAEGSAEQRLGVARQIIVEGALVLPAFDIVSDAGAANKADDKSFFVVVSADGVMNIRFVTRRSTSEPLINAVRVTHRPDR